MKEQKEVEWDVRKFYWNLYKEEETNINITDVLENITKMKKVSQDDKLKLDERITGEEVCRIFKQARYNLIEVYSLNLIRFSFKIQIC